MNKPSQDGQHYDVAIVGGALAGASTAILLLRERPELKVLIIEKSSAFGRRVGEATVEVQSTSQQLHTPYAQSGSEHTQGGAEISRDEVPVALQPYVQQYFEQLRKQAPPTPAKK